MTRQQLTTLCAVFASHACTSTVCAHCWQHQWTSTFTSKDCELFENTTLGIQRYMTSLMPSLWGQLFLCLVFVDFCVLCIVCKWLVPVFNMVQSDLETLSEIKTLSEHVSVSEKCCGLNKLCTCRHNFGNSDPFSTLGNFLGKTREFMEVITFLLIRMCVLV